MYVCIEAVLFAYREVRQKSVRFLPFQLLYGRTVRGPMAILRELWTKEEPSDEVCTTYQYVLDLRNCLEDTCQLVKESLSKSSDKAKKHFDRKTRMRELQAGGSVLIMRPTDSSKLLMQWKGPYQVVERVGMTDYRIRIGKTEKVCHINMLKKYFELGDSNKGVSGASKNTEKSSDLENVAAAAIEDETDEDVELMLPGLSPGGSETVKDVHISNDLSDEQQQQLWQLVNEFQDIFSDRPGEIKEVEHRIRLTGDNPIHSKPYPVPHAMKEVIKEEVKEMERLGVIEHSNSPYASLLLIVKKKDGSNRSVVDFRCLNKVTCV